MRAFDYARILFDVATSAQKLEQIGYQFEAFVDAVEEHENWLVLMELPGLSLEKKKQILFELLDFDESLKSFLVLLIENKDMRLLDNIYDEFANLSYAAQKLAHVRIYSAKPLTKKELREVETELAPIFEGQKIALQVIIDKSVLAGYRLVFQGQSIDRTLKHDLDELKTIL